MKLFLVISFLLQLLSLSSSSRAVYGEFTAELRAGELLIGSVCSSSWSGAADTTTTPCEIVPGTVSGLIQLTTCAQSSSNSSSVDPSSQAAASAGSVFPMSDTLVAHLSPHENCSTTGCQWIFELADRFLDVPCIDVNIADFTTTIPPLRGIRKRVWMGSHTHKDSAVDLADLPQCLQNTELLQWSMVESDHCSEDHRSFSPSNQYTVSSTEVFVTGINSLLFSPCRGCMWYQLLLPSSSNITSFVHFSHTFYALLTIDQNGDAALWVGVPGISPLLSVYPSPALDWVWLREPDTLNSFLRSASLALDTQENLIAVSDGEELKLPISLLLSHSLYNHHLTLDTSNQTSLISSLLLSTGDDIISLEDRPHPLLRLPRTSLVCPLRRVVVEAPICDRVTRSLVEIERAGLLEFVSGDLLPWLNCEVMSEALPSDVFLRRGERYVFTVHLIINPLLTASEIDMTELQVVSTLSRPDTVDVVTQRTFHATTSTVTYQVSVCEVNGSSTQMQVPPATVLQSVDVNLQVRGVGLECVDPLNHHPELLGRMQTRVHVGCPPGISLVFDHITTQAHNNQFCTPPTDNISCYYFGNEFRPVMQLVDSVTGERSTYTGPYTLRVLAGGSSKTHMETFSSSPNVQSQIWTVSADDIISHSSNKIEWTCGLGSPCGELLPGAGRSPEYYLRLQASNRVVGQQESYCDLTVEFTVRLHGLSMGPITTFITLILLLVLLVVPLISLFLVWVWRERKTEAGLSEERGGMVEWYRREVVGRGREMAVWLKEKAEELVRRYQQTHPLESHLHTD